ncbi:MAG TPA: MaoC/PaaZ C-terminal domain-containing protein [Candidatus Hydrogenedentes bacterium]|nr:MaoC/PaaZ C-terminal domain-containing protein [Candidatus Hydrogenedentota bacterium]HNT87551.1 MaoC/PaaZ C-terminal domain-containing protein [Candidatus Hydrogenedentota bacterium]
MSTDEGIYFEDIEEGRVATSPARTVTEADIVNFAGLSGDFNILHTDAEFMKGTPFGQRIAHGLLGLSIASGLVARNPGAEQHRLVAFLGMTWDFRNPVLIGDTIHVVQTAASKRPTSKPGLGVVVYDVQVKNQRGQVCQEGQWKVMYMKRNVG